MRDDVGVLVDDAKETAMAGVAEVKNSVGRMVNAAKAKGGAVVEGASNQIAAAPFKSVGIAFGVGILCGILLSRRRD